METSSPKLPIKPDRDASDLISLSERARLEAIEEYRFDFRKRLEEREKEKPAISQLWKEKLIAPAVIVILTVGLSGYVVPKAFERSQKAQRVRDVTNKLLDEIALNTGEMKVGIESYAKAQDTYWSDAARTNAIYREFIVRRDVGAITTDTFEKENALIENDRKRVHDRIDAAAAAYDQQATKFRTWVIRTRVRITTLYPEDDRRAEVQTLLERIGASVTRADQAVEEKEELYDKALNSHIAAFKELRAQLRSNRIPAQSYQQGTAAIIEKLRNFDHIEGPGRGLDDKAIEDVMKILRGMEAVP